MISQEWWREGSVAYLQAIYQQGWESSPGDHNPYSKRSPEGRVWEDGHKDSMWANCHTRPDDWVSRLLRRLKKLTNA